MSEDGVAGPDEQVGDVEVAVRGNGSARGHGREHRLDTTDDVGHLVCASRQCSLRGRGVEVEAIDPGGAPGELEHAVGQGVERGEDAGGRRHLRGVPRGERMRERAAHGVGQHHDARLRLTEHHRRRNGGLRQQPVPARKTRGTPGAYDLEIDGRVVPTRHGHRAAGRAIGQHGDLRQVVGLGHPATVAGVSAARSPGSAGSSARRHTRTCRTPSSRTATRSVPSPRVGSVVLATITSGTAAPAWLTS